MYNTIQRNIIVSIILSESTTSLLNLNLPCIEETADTDSNIYVIKTIDKSDIKTREHLLSYFFAKQQPNGIESSEVCSSVAYFSSTFQCDSDASLCNNNDELETVDFECKQMEAIYLYTRPLLVAKCSAHENNIFMENNNIYVKISNDMLSITDSDVICRICHGGESIGDLLSPCRCKGTIALTHIECLEHWLKESANSYCELCKHHFRIIREPKYTIPWSIIIYLSNPGNNLKDILIDLFAFVIYTPSAFATTYMLMMICESITKSQLHKTRNLSANLLTFCAVFGMAAIDFTYSSWLIVAFQKHANAWRAWYRSNSFIKLQLPEWKKKPYRHANKKEADLLIKNDK